MRTEIRTLARRCARDINGNMAIAMALVAVPLPDAPDTYGFMDGPVVLAGLNAAPPHDPQQRPAKSDKTHPIIFISGGQRGLNIELSPKDLIKITNAQTAAIS